jgi:hypothetical protein
MVSEIYGSGKCIGCHFFASVCSYLLENVIDCRNVAACVLQKLIHLFFMLHLNYPLYGHCYENHELRKAVSIRY